MLSLLHGNLSRIKQVWWLVGTQKHRVHLFWACREKFLTNQADGDDLQANNHVLDTHRHAFHSRKQKMLLFNSHTAMEKNHWSSVGGHCVLFSTGVLTSTMA